jgi:hypothetical protein
VGGGCRCLVHQLHTRMALTELLWHRGGRLLCRSIQSGGCIALHSGHSRAGLCCLDDVAVFCMPPCFLHTAAESLADMMMCCVLFVLLLPGLSSTAQASLR